MYAYRECCTPKSQHFQKKLKTNKTAEINFDLYEKEMRMRTRWSTARKRTIASKNEDIGRLLVPANIHTPVQKAIYNHDTSFQPLIGTMPNGLT